MAVGMRLTKSRSALVFCNSSLLVGLVNVVPGAVLVAPQPFFPCETRTATADEVSIEAQVEISQTRKLAVAVVNENNVELCANSDRTA